MTYYMSVSQILITVVAIFSLFSWMQERDERAQEVSELHQTLAAAKAECSPIIDLSMPIDWEWIES
ncbi:hypothetical protein SAMN05216404_106202 [Nitrosospira multiformis]|uniref:Uncharacterized protein n=2 Tax=Nitrosospira multiformis TaxID=1231 RepID=A0A1H8IW21_9PROT|nr:hypothetical protein SAMN05216404_106202 [Nitrosospira multiformis]